jgi:uncharacterized protein with GYD domain
MAKYALFFSYTHETWARLMDNPTDRAAAVRATVEEAGGTFDSLYYMFGDHDGIVISDFPDPADAAAFALVVASTGAFASLETRQLFSSSELPNVLNKAVAAKDAYVKPGD